VKTVLADSIPFPDVYMCYDSEFASLFKDGFLKAKYITKTINGEECKGLTATPSLAQVSDFKSQKCFIKTTEASHPKDLNADTQDQVGKAGKLDPALNAKAKQLADLIPRIPGTSQAAFCFAYSGKDVKVTPAEGSQMAFFVWDFEPDMVKIDSHATPHEKFANVMEKGQYCTLYLVEAGADVVKDGKALVNGALFPAFGTISLATIEADQIKDELAGDTKFHWRYRAGVTPIADRSSHYFTSNANTFKDTSWTMASVFNIFSFNVNQIHIRSMTFGEIWSQIGGLWGGAVLVMSLIFTGSGFIRKSDHKELLVLRFQPIKAKKAAILKADGFNKGNDEAAEKQDMKDRLAKLEAKIEELNNGR